MRVISTKDANPILASQAPIVRIARIIEVSFELFIRIMEGIRRISDKIIISKVKRAINRCFRCVTRAIIDEIVLIWRRKNVGIIIAKWIDLFWLTKSMYKYTYLAQETKAWSLTPKVNIFINYFLFKDWYHFSIFSAIFSLNYLNRYREWWVIK